jgi:cathepsin B
MRLALILLVATVAVAYAAPVPYTNCGTGNDHIVIKSVSASPFPPTKGSPITVNATGVLDEGVTSGNYELKVSYLGIPLLDKKGDLCTLDPSFPCPFKAGPITISKTETIPSVAPSGAYDIQLSATDQNGQQLLCISLNVTISVDADADKPTLRMLGDEEPIQNRDVINHVNNMNAGWTAGYNKRLDQLTVAQVKGLCGALEGGEKLPTKYDTSFVPEALPENFESSAKWNMCTSIATIRDQGSCGSCWAVAAAETLSDRACIASNGAFNEPLASEDVLSCCGFSCGSGCDGGYPGAAMSYAVQTGLVTGGPYNSTKWCYPYGIAPCEHHVSGSRAPCGSIEPTPQCSDSCVNGQTWTSSKNKASNSYSVPSDVPSIQKEIYLNGPVEAAFTVYADFPSYKSGVYQHTTGQALGGHAVKVVGWGSDNGTPYWLVANSWNYDWGNNGYFKILRGADECGIESAMVAATFSS